jgi:biopolymer transport protein ExbD
MARTFRRQRQSHPIAELNVTNLIDLGFTLLVIFMITTPLIDKEQTMRVNLPTVAKAEPTRPEPGDHFVTVTIDAGGAYYLSPAATPVSLSELHTRFLAFAAEPKPPVVTVRCDASVPFQKYAAVLNELMRAGLTRISLPTKPNE